MLLGVWPIFFCVLLIKWDMGNSVTNVNTEDSIHNNRDTENTENIVENPEFSEQVCNVPNFIILNQNRRFHEVVMFTFYIYILFFLRLTRPSAKTMSKNNFIIAFFIYKFRKHTITLILKSKLEWKIQLMKKY